MHSIPSNIIPFGYTILALLLITSCTNGSNEPKSERLASDQPVPVDAKHLFTITDINDTTFFGYVGDIVVAMDHTIFVSDPTTRKIHLFKNNGDFIGSLGGLGAGPGEFRRISSMSLLAPNILQVVDISLARITTFKLQDGQWGLSEISEIPLNTDIGLDFGAFVFKRFYYFKDGYIALFESTISSLDTSDFIKECFVLYGRDFTPLHTTTPICFNKLKLITIRSSDSSVYTVSAMPIPKGYETLHDITSGGHIISTYTENTVIKIQHMNQSDLIELEYISEHIPITSEHKELLVAGAFPNEGSSHFARNQVIDSIPSYLGYAEQLLTDDKDQIWILARTNESELRWLLYDFSGKYVGETNHPGGTFKLIKENKIYVSHNSNDAIPGFSVYSLSNSP